VAFFVSRLPHAKRFESKRLCDPAWLPGEPVKGKLGADPLKFPYLSIALRAPDWVVSGHRMGRADGLLNQPESGDS